MATSSSESRSYSLHGRNLKLTTRQEAQPYVDELEQATGGRFRFDRPAE